MRRTIAFLFAVVLFLFSVAGCAVSDSSSSDDGANAQSATTTVTSTIDCETSTTLNGSSEHIDTTTTTTTTTERKTTTQKTTEFITICPTRPPSPTTTTTTTEWKTTTQKTTEKTKTICPTRPPSPTTTTVRTTLPTVTPVSRLPNVKFLHQDSNVRFTDMANLSNGGFAISGHWYTETKIESIIQIYDKNATLENQYTYHNENSNGFDKIALCSDGGFIAASQQLTKINSNFETEWSVAYEENTKFRQVFDIEEINPNCYAVAFASFDDVMKLKIVFLDKNGEFVETIDVVNDIFADGTDIISDGNSGFYLLTSCNKSTADMYPLVEESYDSSKATEAIIMHFSAERELIRVKTLGGGGNDWIEEAAIDENGNIYLAVGTDWNGADFFWEMSVDRTLPYRRMLVKLDKKGTVVYRAPLANKGMAVDQVFGIHIKDDIANVVGMSDYFDGYQVKYPCEQILPNEKGNRVFCVYNACIDGDGIELDRKIFRCDVNNMPCDSALLLNGSLVIAGRVSADVNPFDLKFPSGVDAAAALFIYTGDGSVS